MKIKKENISIEPQFIINKTGKKTAVVLDIKTYESILESLEDFYLGAKSEQILQKCDFIDFAKANKRITKK